MTTNPQTARPDRTDVELLTRRRRVLGGAYRLFYTRPVQIVRGSGTRLWDAHGNEYLDAYNNVAVVGHCHPRVVAALASQAAVLNTHTRYLGGDIVAYAERLLAEFPPHLEQVMLTCSGSEANDLAYRIARVATGGDGVIITEYAYHGVTVAMSELSPSLGSGNRLAHHAQTVPAPTKGPEAFAADVEAAIARLEHAGHRPAALLIDTVFASDGLWPDPIGLLAPAAAAIKRAGGLLIADEVQAGFGRPGLAMWGFARHEVAPDIVTLGKPMGNGHPLAGIVARSDLLHLFGQRSRYFNTFAGNPVACRVGLAVLDVIAEEGLMRNAQRIGRQLTGGLHDLQQRHHTIADVRTVGLYAGIEIAAVDGSPSAERTTQIVDELRERGVLVGISGPDANVIKIRPPLVFSAEDCDRLLETLETSLQKVG